MQATQYKSKLVLGPVKSKNPANRNRQKPRNENAIDLAKSHKEAEEHGKRLGQDYLMGSKIRPGNDDWYAMKPTDMRYAAKPTTYDEAWQVLRLIGFDEANYNELQRLNMFERMFANCGHVPLFGALRAENTNAIVHMQLGKYLMNMPKALPRGGRNEARLKLKQTIGPSLKDKYKTFADFIANSEVYAQLERVTTVCEMFSTPIKNVPLADPEYMRALEASFTNTDTTIKRAVAKSFRTNVVRHVTDPNGVPTPIDSHNYLVPGLLRENFDKILIPHLNEATTLKI